jgi:UDP-N-acetylmuramoylalanine--D-glutamate ligase
MGGTEETMAKVVILGAGRSGIAAAEFLAVRGAEIWVTDSGSPDSLPYVSNLPEGVDTVFGGHPEALLDGADLIVLSPGVPRSIPFLKAADARGIEVISEIELAVRHLRGRVVAVTGSNGKSTTTALIGHILGIAGLDPVVAGNIGDPLVSRIDPERERVYVVELSSFQLETLDTFHADVAVLLNITPDHLDRYESLESYAAAKYEIFRGQTSEDVAVVNAADPRTAEPPTPASVRRFSSASEIIPGAWRDRSGLHYSVDGDEARIDRASLRLEGDANVENALAAWLAARAAGAEHSDVEEGFGSFRGLPHRMEVIAEVGGARWINDSKGTNPDATGKSLEGASDGRVILILGGKDKGGDFGRLRSLVEKKVRLLLTIGEAAPRIESMLEGATETIRAETMDRAVEVAAAEASRGDLVLLSPACASFDQYRDFEQRGEHFTSLVRALEGVRQ